MDAVRAVVVFEAACVINELEWKSRHKYKCEYAREYACELARDSLLALGIVGIRAVARQRLTKALGAAIASCRPRAFRLPSLLVGGTPLLAFYKHCTGPVHLIATVMKKRDCTYS